MKAGYDDKKEAISIRLMTHSVCVCVCILVRQGERERERKKTQLFVVRDPDKVLCRSLRNFLSPLYCVCPPRKLETVAKSHILTYAVKEKFFNSLFFIFD